MRLWGFIFLMVLAYPLTAQQPQKYRFKFEKTPLEQAIQEVEAATDYTFYYAPSWLDSLTTGQVQVEGSIADVVEKLLTDTRLEFLLLDNKIILTYNTPIITSLPTEANPPSAEAVELMFAREYEQNADKADPAAKTWVIGSKSKLKPGSSVVLAGFITAKETGKPLADAHVQVPSTQEVTSTDATGFYSIRLPSGKTDIRIQFVGMKPTTRRLVVFSDGTLNIALEPDEVILEEIEIQANADANIHQVQMGVSRIGLAEMKNIPKILGENDVIQVALTLPGVQTVGEGAAGLNVRGGKPDQNLMLFNNATVYNPFHFFGFFSSFNTDLLESSELYKSSIPVHFGSRLASVFDVKMKAGNKEKISGQGGISPVTSQLSLEVPLLKNKTSLLVGGRSTYSDWIVRRIDNANIRNSNPLFWDIAGGIDHHYKGNNTLNVSGYYSYDRFRLSTDSLYAYNNLSASLQWRHHLTNAFSSTLSATTSRYRYTINYDALPEEAYEYGFSIQDSWSQLAFEYALSDAHTLQFGADAKLYQIDPAYKRPKSAASQVLGSSLEQERGVEGALFISDNYVINTQWSVYGGLRYSGFTRLGPFTHYLYEEGAPKTANTLADSVRYGRGNRVAMFQGPELRFSLRYSVNPATSFKAAYNRTRQYIHTLSNSVSISPLDTWRLADQDFDPQLADQYSLGFFRNLKNNTIETSLEVYYKHMQNLLDYKTGANLVLNQHMEADVLQGIGKAYGAELLVKKNSGKLNGWVSYTYSRSLQQFRSDYREEQINGGSFFPSNFDKPHSLFLISNYKLTKRFSFSFNLNYATGRPVTYPTATYQIGGVEVVHYADRNSFRIPDYFRIDLGLNIEGNHRIKKLAHGFWSISVYNVLGRDNAYSIFFRNEGGTLQGYQLSVLAVPIPSISYKFKF